MDRLFIRRELGRPNEDYDEILLDINEKDKIGFGNTDEGYIDDHYMIPIIEFQAIAKLKQERVFEQTIELKAQKLYLEKTENERKANTKLKQLVNEYKAVIQKKDEQLDALKKTIEIKNNG